MKFALLNTHDSHLREMLSKGAVAFGLKILGAGLAFLLQFAIARYLGASGAGVYFLALTIITLVATVVRLGMDNSVTRFVAAHASEKNWSKVKGVVCHATRITLVISMLASALLFFLAEWLATVVFNKPELARPLQLMSLIITPLAVMTLYAKALQGLKRVRDTMLMQSVLAPLVASIALVIFAPLLGISGAVLAYGLGVMCTLCFGFWTWQRAKSGWAQASAAFSTKTLLASSFPLLGAVLLGQIAQALPLLLLGRWGSSAHVGVFGAAQRTAALVSLVLIAANVIIAPKFAELYQKKDMAELSKVARHATLLMTAMASPAFGLFMLAPQWVMGLFGAEFSAGWVLLLIMALGQSVNVMTGSVGFLLAMTGQEKSMFFGTLWAAALNVILCLTLIPLYDATGAAIASAVSLAAMNLLMVWVVWKSMGIMTLPMIRVNGGIKRK